MVDFRYHLVSIIAIFLALAVGIVVGTTALNGPIRTNLNGNLSRSPRRSAGSRATSPSCGRRSARPTTSPQRSARGWCAATLEDERVLLVTTPQTPADLVEQLTPLLDQAGAQVTGTLRLQPELSDPAQRPLVEDLVAQVVPAGVELPDTGAVERAAAELAAALTRPPERATASSPSRRRPSCRPSRRPTWSSSPTAERDAAAGDARRGPHRRRARRSWTPPSRCSSWRWCSLAGALDARAAGAVVAGPAGSARRPRSRARAARRRAPSTREVSTVDNADRGTGQVVAGAGAAPSSCAAAAGQYGTGAGASDGAAGRRCVVTGLRSAARGRAGAGAGRACARPDRSPARRRRPVAADATTAAGR